MCSDCQNQTAQYYGIPCDDCLKTPEYQKKLKKDAKRLGGAGTFAPFKEAVAFGRDKQTGRPYALDKDGKRFDPKDSRYNKENDPHGWKAAGVKK